MARTSKYQKFKVEVVKEFEAGLTPVDVYSKFPDIPRSTIRDWYKSIQADPIPPKPPPIPPNSAPPAPPQLALVPPPPREESPIPIFQGGYETDLAYIQRKLRAIANNDKTTPGVQVQAVMGLLKVVELRSSGRVKEDFIPTETPADFSDLSTEELMESFRDLISYDGA